MGTLSEVFSFQPYLDPLAPGTTSPASQPAQVAHQTLAITLRLILATSAYVNFSLPVRFAGKANFISDFMSNSYGAIATVSWKGCPRVIPALGGQLNIPQCVWLAIYQITVKGHSSSITW